LEESTLPYIAGRVGLDKLLYSSVYPHWDTSWPNTVCTVRERQDNTEAAKEAVSVRQCSEVLLLHGKSIEHGLAVQQTIHKERAAAVMAFNFSVTLAP
jgi:hypothetical protein